MDALLFALALEVTLLQIRIVEGSTELRAYKWKKHLTKSETLQREKLVKDRGTVQDVVRSTIIELSESGEWNTLQRVADRLRQRASSALAMRLDHSRLNVCVTRNQILIAHIDGSREAIRSELTEKRYHWAHELCNADEKVALLRDKLKDGLHNASTRLLYAEKWLCARSETLDLQCQVEQVPRPNVEHEERVHDALLKAFEMQVKEREISLEYWQGKYDSDTATILKNLSERREQLRVTLARREELQKLYNLHEGEMRAWLTFKRERAARLEREERRRISAVRIQAWWRGVMVRKGLGPFRHLRSAKKPPTKSKKK